ncbi:MAG: hypothetical protein HQM06_05775 [Magnetococcales bacterium]|nr:hypothetical protein [Magnetococcales bacterium]
MILFWLDGRLNVWGQVEEKSCSSAKNLLAICPAPAYTVLNAATTPLLTHALPRWLFLLPFVLEGKIIKPFFSFDDQQNILVFHVFNTYDCDEAWERFDGIVFIGPENLLAICRALVHTAPNITATPIPRIRSWHAQPWRFFVAPLQGGTHG